MALDFLFHDLLQHFKIPAGSLQVTNLCSVRLLAVLFVCCAIRERPSACNEARARRMVINWAEGDNSLVVNTSCMKRRKRSVG